MFSLPDTGSLCEPVCCHDGLAAIEVLEELRVPVHCIAGTSMGAIVGASYASGMGTDEMLAEMAKITSERLFNDKPPRADQPCASRPTTACRWPRPSWD
jgi:predicted acylesterase/phospholipase RssA